jgi:LysR family transcriptional regulator, glycine cleavage system transcriptional activator
MPMRRLPPLNTLLSFESAARHASFQRAAKELHVTASAVSHQIKALEKFLDVALFRRGGRQVQLTREGENYLVAVREGLKLIATATERIHATRAGGVLTLSVAPSFASPWLVPRLAGFQLDHPELEVRLTSSIDLVDFAKSDVDAAVRYGAGRWPGLNSCRLFSEELIPVASPQLRIGKKRLLKPTDLRQATLLHVMSRLGQWRMWLAAAGITDIDAERGPRFHSTPLALEAAIAGHGVAIADRGLIANHIRSGELIALFDIVLPTEFAYYLVYPKGREDDPNIAVFRQWLLAESKRPATPEP